MKMNVSKILPSARPMKSEDRETGICIPFWRVVQAGIASICSLPFCFGECYAMCFFFLQHFKSGTPYDLFSLPKVNPSARPLPSDRWCFYRQSCNSDAFWCEWKERWHGILIKYQFESECRSELPAGTVCLIPMGETMMEGQGKSNCFAFVAGEVLTMGLPQLSWHGAIKTLHI